MLAFAHSVAALFVARALAGFMAGNLSAAMAYASDISQPADRTRTMGAVGAAIGIGFMLGPGIAACWRASSCRARPFLRPALVSAAAERTGDAAGAVPAAREPTRRNIGVRTPPRLAPRAHALQLLRLLPALRWLDTCHAAGDIRSVDAGIDLPAIWAMNRYHVGPRTVGMALFALAIVRSRHAGRARCAGSRRVMEKTRLAIAGIVFLAFGVAKRRLRCALPVAIIRPDGVRARWPACSTPAAWRSPRARRSRTTAVRSCGTLPESGYVAWQAYRTVSRSGPT